MATIGDIDTLLERSAALHRHLCPRQVLGVRTGLLAARLLDLPLPQDDKRVFAFVETDGCYADGVSVAAGCWLGKRTLRLFDRGKVAATLADTHTGRAFRIATCSRASCSCSAVAVPGPSSRPSSAAAVGVPAGGGCATGRPPGCGDAWSTRCSSA